MYHGNVYTRLNELESTFSNTFPSCSTHEIPSPPSVLVHESRKNLEPDGPSNSSSADTMRCWRSLKYAGACLRIGAGEEHSSLEFDSEYSASEDAPITMGSRLAIDFLCCWHASAIGIEMMANDWMH